MWQKCVPLSGIVEALERALWQPAALSQSAHSWAGFPAHPWRFLEVLGSSVPQAEDFESS